MTRRSKGSVQVQPECFVEISQFDADMHGMKNGEMIKVITRRGSVKTKVMITEIKEGVIWMPMHFAEAAVNKLTISAYDNITMTAEYKVCAARIEKVGEAGKKKKTKKTPTATAA